jgi:hypothetical protein
LGKGLEFYFGGGVELGGEKQLVELGLFCSMLFVGQCVRHLCEGVTVLDLRDELSVVVVGVGVLIILVAMCGDGVCLVSHLH